MAKKAKTLPDTKHKFTGEAIMEELKSLASFGSGVIAGSLGGKLIDKALKVDASDTTFNAKSLVRPVVLLGAGATGALMLEDKHIKMFSTGVGASGLLSGVKVILKKDVLNGLADFSGLGEPTKVFREPVTLSIERYNPDLPALEARRNITEEIAAVRADENMSGSEQEKYSFTEII